MVEKWVPHWQMDDFNKDWWVTSVKTNKWHSYRCVCARISFVRVCECHLFVFAKMKKRCLRNKKKIALLLTTAPPKSRRDDETTGRRWSERSERNPCWWGATPAQAPTGRQTLSAPIHLLSLSLLRSSVRGVPHQQGFRPFRTPPPACSLSSLRDFGGTFADSRKKIAYGTKKNRTSIDSPVPSIVTLQCFSCLTP